MKSDVASQQDLVDMEVSVKDEQETLLEKPHAQDPPGSHVTPSADLEKDQHHAKTVNENMGLLSNKDDDKDEAYELMDAESDSPDDGLPIDRGWAWVVLAGCFMNVVMMVGYGRAVAIMFVEYLDVFDASVTATTLFMGVINAMYSISSLFSMNVVHHLMGSRKTVILGATISSLGMLTAVFAMNITFLICTHSVLVGIGHSMIHSPGLVMVNQYFNKRRGLATSIAMSGISVAACVFPILARYFIDVYGIRGTMLLFTGLTIQILVGAMLYRPLDSFKKKCNKQLEKITVQSNSDQMRKQTQTFEKNNVKDNLKDVVLEVRHRTLSETSNTSSPSDKTASQLRLYASNPDFTSKSLINLAGIEELPISATKKTTWGYIKDAIALLEFSLFKLPMFQLIIVSAVFGVQVRLVSVYLPALAINKGVTETEAALLLTLSGGLDFFGRLFVGYIADLKKIKVNQLMAIGLAISGLVSNFTWFYDSYPLFIVYSVIIGIFGGFFHCLIPIIIVDFMGIEHMAKTLGFVAVTHGISTAVAHPVIGAIRDGSGSYELCFTFIGSCCLISAILLMCEPIARKRKEKQEQRQNELTKFKPTTSKS